MTEGVAIFWAAPREVSVAERRLIASAARVPDAQLRTVSMSSLARELAPSIGHRPVVVVVGSRKDAALALNLGADEVVHVVRSVRLRKSIIGGAIARARARARIRRRPAFLAGPTDRSSTGDGFLVRVLEHRLGSPLDVAATKCKGLADELKGAVDVANRLMQRVQRGTQRAGLKRWRGDVRDYARATLKAEALAVELQEQVGRTNVVVQALDNLSLHTQTTETDVACLLVQLADFLRDCLPEGATLTVHAPEPCVVPVPRTTVISMLSAAIECALYNLLESGTTGRIALRASTTAAKEAVVEVGDDGALVAQQHRGAAKSPSFPDLRAVTLRQLRKRAKRAGGLMTMTSNADGNVLTIHLPLAGDAVTETDARAPVRGRRRRASSAASNVTSITAEKTRRPRP